MFIFYNVSGNSVNCFGVNKCFFLRLMLEVVWFLLGILVYIEWIFLYYLWFILFVVSVILYVFVWLRFIILVLGEGREVGVFRWW